MSLTTDLIKHENKIREMEGITRETNYNRTLKNRKIYRLSVNCGITSNGHICM